ncbi:hypothetical protein ARMGADRAFT_1028524 [Armillaria gallica]|uniref:CxC2-like cysteine cluster KDZ transposase-associated domain-containing protein n=1 Tax=Armillaria gallica TaxID=47427 RepID=A0A2H3DUG3_ARMGA|nr:hypothetical protein ARMGADRAFT_1028524 [Armillaria gallica]
METNYDINAQGVLTTTTTPVVQSDPATIILEQHTTEPATTANVASSSESDIEDDGGHKPIPETQCVLQSFVNILPQLHNLMMEHKADTELHVKCQGLSVDRISQLMRACLFPAMANLPQLAFSFKLLKQFQLLHVNAWQRLMDNKYPWYASNLLVYCPACPEVGWNLEPRSDLIPWEFQQQAKVSSSHTNQLQLTGDGNFHINKAEANPINSDPEDLTLVGDCGIYPNHEDWEQYLKEAEVIKPKGGGKVQCSHIFVLATADFQKGEDQWTMDNALHQALMLANLASDKADSIDVVFSYDINCQYCMHITECFEASMLSHFHGEMAEQFWAFSNSLGPQIHQMNLEHGHEIYFHHANDWNYRKLVNISWELQKDIVCAWKQSERHGSYFQCLMASLPVEQVSKWEKQLCKPSVQGSQKGKSKGWVSPYCHQKQKVLSMDNAIKLLLLNPRKLVAISVVSDEAAKFEKSYPNETNQETIRCKRISLEKSIHHWFELQLKFMGVASKFFLPGISTAEDETVATLMKTLKRKKKKKAAGSSDVETWPLRLPSSLSGEDDQSCLQPLIEYETKLQDGAAFNSLHAVLLSADQLQVLSYNKNKNVHGYKPNMKAQEKLRHVNALLAMGMMDETYLKGLPELKKEDTMRKSVDTYQQTGAPKIINGAAYTWFCHTSIQTAVPPQSGKRLKKKSKKKSNGKDKAPDIPASDVCDMDALPNDGVVKTGWIYELHECGNINAADLQAWIYEENWVQWFHAKAEMLQWQEHHEIKQAEFLRAADLVKSKDPSKLGYIAYAREQAAMLDDMIE